MRNPVSALDFRTTQNRTTKAADRRDDRKADWLWQQIVGNEPANVGDGPHDARQEARQDHRRINTRLVLHCDGVDQHVDGAGDKDPSEMSKHIVHTYSCTAHRWAHGQTGIHRNTSSTCSHRRLSSYACCRREDLDLAKIRKLLPSVLLHCWLGGRKSIQPVKNWVVRYRRGYLCGVTCKWFAYGQLTTLPPHHLLLQ